MENARGPSDDWSEEYANILEFYFWEPQHLNRISPSKEKRRPVNEVISALMKREVPLNHQLNFFFRLAPVGLKARWLGSIFPGMEVSEACFQSLLASPIYAACQPDLYLNSRGSRFFVELKVGAKSSMDQLCKYALLAAYLSLHDADKPSGLLFMGLRRNFSEIEASLLVRHSSDFTLPNKVKAHAARLCVPEEAVLEAARNMEVAFRAYSDFDQYLKSEADQIDGASDGDETLAKLIAGMRNFMRTISK